MEARFPQKLFLNQIIPPTPEIFGFFSSGSMTFSSQLGRAIVSPSIQAIISHFATSNHRMRGKIGPYPSVFKIST